MVGNNLPRLLGKNIATRRKLMGLTQAQLAEKLEIGQDALSRMEIGKISPKISRLACFAKALNCSIAELFSEEVQDLSENALQIAGVIGQLSPKGQKMMVDFLSHLASEISALEK